MQTFIEAADLASTTDTSNLAEVELKSFAIQLCDQSNLVGNFFHHGYADADFNNANSYDKQELDNEKLPVVEILQDESDSDEYLMKKFDVSRRQINCAY
jgi:hypothetical protein